MGGLGRAWRIRLASGWKSGRVEAVSLRTGIQDRLRWLIDLHVLCPVIVYFGPDSLGDVPALLPVLLRLATSTSPLHRLSVYQLIIHHPSILFTLSFSTSTSQEAIPLKSGDVAQLLSRGMEDDFVDVRLAAVKALQGVLEGEHMEDEGRDEVGSDLIGKACHVSRVQLFTTTL
jgi:hypothetical protein